MRIQVSVVVPTCNRPELLSRCLAALMVQDFDPATYEVIVVDDGDDHETRRVVERWHGRHAGAPDARRCRPPLRYLATDGTRGPAAARNCGWRAAHGDIIAFTDDDCIPLPSWLRAGTAAFSNGNPGVMGRLVVPLPEPPTDYQQNLARMERSRFLTANCFYRRDALAAVGGFDERFTDAWREDSDLLFTLIERHGDPDHFAHAPQAVVVHPPRSAPWGVSIRDQRKSMFNALLYKKHPGLYREMIQTSPPWHYYQIVGALLLGLGAWLNGRWRLGALATAVWALLTGRFCLQRLNNTSRAPEHVAEMVVTSIAIPPLSIFWRLVGALKFRVLFF